MEENKTILIPHIVTLEEESKLKFEHLMKGYKLEMKIINYVKKETCYRFKLETKLQ